MNEEALKQVVQYKTYEEFVKSESTYDETVAIAKDMVGFPENGIEGEEALKLISLICQVTLAYRTKTPEAKPIHILTKAYGKAECKGALKQYRQICVMCELFLTPDAKFSMHGYKDVAEMLQEIKRIMDQWLPF